MTLADVAEVAGVSAPTVSRALRNDAQISEATKLLVQRVADQLGYVPNLTARSLATASTQILGLMIPDVTDPVHGQIVVGFEREAQTHGYTVLLANIDVSPEKEWQALRAFVSNQADGFAIFGGVLAQGEVIGAAKSRPAIFINTEHSSGYRGDQPLGCIRSDDDMGVGAAVRHAIAGGHRRLAYLNGWNVASNSRRRRAATRALSEFPDLPPLQSWSVDESRGYSNLARRIAGANIDLVICYDDKLALSLLNAFRELGIRVPDDVGVIGFDDIPFAAISWPRLTTISAPYVSMGEQAVRMLMERLQFGELPPSTAVETRLVVRETTRSVEKP